MVTNRIVGAVPPVPIDFQVRKSLNALDASQLVAKLV